MVKGRFALKLIKAQPDYCESDRKSLLGVGSKGVILKIIPVTIFYNPFMISRHDI